MTAPVYPLPTPVILDTDIQGDVDDVGAVAVLHALAARGEAEITEELMLYQPQP